MTNVEQATNTLPETHGDNQSAPALTADSVKKPTRCDFYVDVVLNSKGEVIEESVWKPVVGDTAGRTRTGKLRRNGMQLVHVFKKAEYEDAKRSFADQSRKARIAERDSLIIGAFQRADVPNDPHIERALRDLLPIFNGTPASKTANVLRNVVKTVANGAGIKAE